MHETLFTELHGQRLAQFIRDAREDLLATEVPFGIGVTGIGGRREGGKPPHLCFRQAKAAPTSVPEFPGNVVAVETAPYWDDDWEALQRRMGKWDPKLNRGTANRRGCGLHCGRKLDHTDAQNGSRDFPSGSGIMRITAIGMMRLDGRSSPLICWASENTALGALRASGCTHPLGLRGAVFAGRHHETGLAPAFLQVQPGPSGPDDGQDAIVAAGLFGGGPETSWLLLSHHTPKDLKGETSRRESVINGTTKRKAEPPI